MEFIKIFNILNIYIYIYKHSLRIKFLTDSPIDSSYLEMLFFFINYEIKIEI